MHTRPIYPLIVMISLFGLFVGLFSGGGTSARAETAESVLYGRFSYFQTGEDIDRQLTHLDGSPILEAEVSLVYGTPDGMTVYEDGVDVCSWEYAAQKALPAPIKPVGMDLSNAAGWPNIHIPPGILAIDPYLGRFYFAEGDGDALSLVGSYWAGFGVPGSGFIKLQGDYAYLPAGEGEVQVFDVSNPPSPRVVDSAYADFNYAIGVNDAHLYLYRNNRGMSAIDISDPTNLDWYADENLTRVWEAPNNLRMNAIEIRGNLAFVTVSAEPGFYILDLTDPLNAVELASLNVGDPKGAQWVFLSGDRAYVALSSANGLLDGTTPYTHRWSGGFSVIDIADPNHPVLLGSYNGEPGETIYTVPRLIGVQGDLAIMAVKWRPGNYPPEQPGRLVLVDASDPLHITRRGDYVFLDGAVNEARVDLYSAVANGNTLYISDDSYDSTSDSLHRDDPEDYTTLFTFDISDPDNPQLITRYDHPQPSRYRHLTLGDDYLYVNDYNYGMRVFDVSTATNPTLAGGIITAAEGHYAWVNKGGTYAFFSQTFGGAIHVVDLQNPGAPQGNGLYWDGDWNEKQLPAGAGDYLYVPTTYQISILDISDPASPTLIGTFPYAPRHPALSVWGGLAYVLSEPGSGTNPYRSQLNIYDLANPATPTLRGVYNLGDTYEKVFARGDHAYLVKSGRLVIVDVSNPDLPTLAGELVSGDLTIVTREEAGRMWLKDGTLYIITGQRDERLFHIVDVSSPASPVFLNTFSYELGGAPQEHALTSLTGSGKYLFMGVYWGNFVLFDISDPSSPVYIVDGKSLPLEFEGWEAGWSAGVLSGEYLVLPTLSHLRLIDVPFESQALSGTVSLTSNLGNPTVVELVDFRAYPFQLEWVVGLGLLAFIAGGALLLSRFARSVKRQ